MPAYRFFQRAELIWNAVREETLQMNDVSLKALGRGFLGRKERIQIAPVVVCVTL